MEFMMRRHRIFVFWLCPVLLLGVYATRLGAAEISGDVLTKKWRLIPSERPEKPISQKNDLEAQLSYQMIEPSYTQPLIQFDDVPREMDHGVKLQLEHSIADWCTLKIENALFYKTINRFDRGDWVDDEAKKMLTQSSILACDVRIHSSFTFTPYVQSVNQSHVSTAGAGDPPLAFHEQRAGLRFASQWGGMTLSGDWSRASQQSQNEWDSQQVESRYLEFSHYLTPITRSFVKLDQEMVDSLWNSTDTVTSDCGLEFHLTEDSILTIGRYDSQLTSVVQDDTPSRITAYYANIQKQFSAAWNVVSSMNYQRSNLPLENVEQSQWKWELSPSVKFSEYLSMRFGYRLTRTDVDYRLVSLISMGMISTF